MICDIRVIYLMTGRKRQMWGNGRGFVCVSVLVWLDCHKLVFSWKKKKKIGCLLIMWRHEAHSSPPNSLHTLLFESTWPWRAACQRTVHYTRSLSLSLCSTLCSWPGLKNVFTLQWLKMNGGVHKLFALSILSLQIRHIGAVPKPAGTGRSRSWTDWDARPQKSVSVPRTYEIDLQLQIWVETKV